MRLEVRGEAGREVPSLRGTRGHPGASRRQTAHLEETAMLSADQESQKKRQQSTKEGTALGFRVCSVRGGARRAENSTPGALWGTGER